MCSLPRLRPEQKEDRWRPAGIEPVAILCGWKTEWGPSHSQLKKSRCQRKSSARRTSVLGWLPVLKEVAVGILYTLGDTLTYDT